MTDEEETVPTYEDLTSHFMAYLKGVATGAVGVGLWWAIVALAL